MLDTKARKYVQPLLDQIADFFIKMGASANGVTIAAFVIGVLAAVLTCLRWFWPAVSFLWLSGILDAVDGTIARKTGSSSPLGTLLDIVFDRVVEILLLLAIIFVAPDQSVYVAVVLSSIIISMTIFLTVGASAKNTTKKSFYYQAGIAERTEGFLMISLAILLENHRSIVLMAFAALILFTAAQRFLEGIRLLNRSE